MSAIGTKRTSLFALHMPEADKPILQAPFYRLARDLKPKFFVRASQRWGSAWRLSNRSLALQTSLESGHKWFLARDGLSDIGLKAGIVTSLNRPGGNVTGISFLINSLGTKRVELLSQIAPRASTIGMLANPTNPDAEIEISDAQAAAQALGRKLLVARARTEKDFEPAFAMLVEQGAGALAVAGDPFFLGKGLGQIVALAARFRLPAIYFLRQYPAAGGLMSYGTSLNDTYHEWGVYVGCVLKGETPADLPVIQSTKFEFVINLKTAKTLGLAVPPALLAIADEVIE